MLDAGVLLPEGTGLVWPTTSTELRSDLEDSDCRVGSNPDDDEAVRGNCAAFEARTSLVRRVDFPSPVERCPEAMSLAGSRGCLSLRNRFLTSSRGLSSLLLSVKSLVGAVVTMAGAVADISVYIPTILMHNQTYELELVARFQLVVSLSAKAESQRRSESAKQKISYACLFVPGSGVCWVADARNLRTSSPAVVLHFLAHRSTGASRKSVARLHPQALRRAASC